MTGNTLGNSTGSQETEEVLHIIFISTTSTLIYLYARCPRWLGKFKSKEKKCNMAKLNEQPWIPCKIRGWCSSWKATGCPPQSALPKLIAGIVGNALPQLPCGEKALVLVDAVQAHGDQGTCRRRKNVSLRTVSCIEVEVTWLTGIYENLLGHLWFALAKYTHSPVLLSLLFSLPWVKR